LTSSLSTRWKRSARIGFLNKQMDLEECFNEFKSQNVDYIIHDAISVPELVRASVDSGYANTGNSTKTYSKIPLEWVHEKGVKLLLNSDFEDPKELAVVFRRRLRETGISLKVVVIEFDNFAKIIDRNPNSRQSKKILGAIDRDDIQIFKPLIPFGAFPISKSLSDGADIIITNTCSGSSLTMGACLDWFRWGKTEYNMHAQACLLGHVMSESGSLSCPPPPDWTGVSADAVKLNSCIAEISGSGEFLLRYTNGGSNQLVFLRRMISNLESPKRHTFADVICDLSGINIQETESRTLKVSDAQGISHSNTYHVYCISRRSICISHKFEVCKEYTLDQTLPTGLLHIIEKCVSDLERSINSLLIRKGSSNEVKIDYKIRRMSRTYRPMNVLSIEVSRPDNGYVETVERRLRIRFNELMQHDLVKFYDRGSLGWSLQPIILEVPKTFVSPSIRVLQRKIRVSEARRHRQSTCVPNPDLILVRNNLTLGAHVTIAQVAWVTGFSDGIKINLGLICREDKILPYLIRHLTVELLSEHVRGILGSKMSHNFSCQLHAAGKLLNVILIDFTEPRYMLGINCYKLASKLAERIALDKLPIDAKITRKL
jgi:acyclic terpene utilization AtuA family protein